jgi:hypothetical protein
MALFARAPSLQLMTNASGARGQIAEVEPRKAGQLISVGLLILCIATGLYGTQDQFANFNMTFFWVIFVLAVPYATLLLGDFYSTVNPWRAIVSWCDTSGRGAFAGVLRYPKKLGYYPALLLYMVFIWLELFGELTPRGLSLALLAYSLVNVGGAWLFGCRDWFQYGEFFGVFLRLLGRVAPLNRSASGEWRWRLPFAGLFKEKTEHVSLLLFILFMLSSTAYDGLHETRPWIELFWGGMYPHFSPLLSDIPRVAYGQTLIIYKIWQWFCLFASPFIYLAVVQIFVAAANVMAKTQCSIRNLSLRFAPALIPIAIVYHITHYYPTLLSQGVQIVRLISDPFGFGWDIFGTGRLAISAVMIDAGLMWKTQVCLIVAGHIVSSYVGHAEALKMFANTRKATLSQVPILLLMVLFTTVGLKILSMPMAPSQ